MGLARINLAPEIGGVLGPLATSGARFNPTSRAGSPNLSEGGASEAESLTAKNLEATLQERRTFFYTFLTQKYGQIQYTLVSTRKLENLSGPTKNTNKDYKKSPTERAMISNSSSNYSKNNKKTNPTNSRSKTSLPLKACAIKCKDKVHKGGSLYYCQTFRQKSLKDKNELHNKVRICRLCLQPQHIGANGHIDTSLCLLSDI